MTRTRSVTLMRLLPLLVIAPTVGFAQDVMPPPGAQPAPSGVVQPVPPAALQPAPAPAAGAAAAAQPAVVTYSVGQLDQMLAPIALYPDTLLGDVLMASTFPVEIVEAERWLADPAHAALRGDQLVAALQPMTWDPSVKSLVPFPAVLKELNDQLDWAQSLGTAFVNQQADVMAQVQVLRQQAEACGKLTTTPQQLVRHEGPAVIIEPANPQVVYVPVYNPAVVYGTWAYAAYPPLYFAPYPEFFVGPVGIGIGFSVGFGVVGPLWGWGYPAWGAGNIFIDGGRWSSISFNHVGFSGSAFHRTGPIGGVGAAAFHGPGAAGAFGRSAAGVGAARGAFGRGATGRVAGAGSHGLQHASAAHGIGASHARASGSVGRAGASHAAFHGNAGHAAFHGNAGHAASRGNAGHAASRGNVGHAAFHGNSGHASGMSRASHSVASHSASHAPSGHSSGASHGGGHHR